MPETRVRSPLAAQGSEAVGDVDGKAPRRAVTPPSCTNPVRVRAAPSALVAAAAVAARFSDNRIAVTDEGSGPAIAIVAPGLPGARSRLEPVPRASVALGKSTRPLRGEVQVRLLPEASRSMGAWRNGRAQRPLTPLVAGSNPAAPTIHAAVVQRQDARFPSSRRGFESRRSLQHLERAWPSGRGTGLPSRRRGFESRCPLHRRGVVQWQDAGP